MVDLTQAHKASIELLGTRHTALVEAVRNYVNGSVQPSIDELIAAIEDVTTDIDTKEKMLLGLASRQATKPVPSLILDFKTRHYLQGARRPEKGYGIHDLLSVERASPKWVYNASGKLTEVPANQPAYQHDPVTGEPLGLLIEGSRTNLLTWSEDFTQSPWSRQRATLTATTENAVVGSKYYKMVVQAGESNGYLGFPGIANSGSGSFVCQYFVKKAEYDVIRIQCVHQGEENPTSTVVFDMTTGQPGPLERNITSAGSSPLKDGGWKIWAAFSVEQAPTVTARLFYPYGGDGESGILVSAAQFEEGTHPSSYIPTTDAPATRDADDVRRELGDEFNPNGFTVYGEFHSVGNNVNGNPRIFSLEGPGTNRISLRVGAPTNRHAQLQIVNSGGAILNTTMSLPAWPGSGLVKIAYSVKNGVAIMGWDRQAKTAVFEGSLPDIELFSPVFANRYFSTYTEALIIPRALTEAELIELIS